MKLRRSSVVALVAGALVLSACSNSAPPAAELAEEMIDTLDVSDEVKDCMKQELADFELTEEEAKGFSDLDDVATKAADGQEQAKQILARWEAALTSCTTAG